MNIEIKGRCMGVKLTPRDSTSDNDKHISVTIQVEDDENWFDKVSFSSAWLDELIENLQAAKRLCESQEPDIHDGRQYGWKFKDQ